MKRKLTQKIISCMLAVGMLLTAWGISAQAETVSDMAKATERQEPQNPVHHCTEDDDTDWSYVYFGRYPQTEVTGDALTEEIVDASYDGPGQSNAWVNGEKYMRTIAINGRRRYFKCDRIKWRVLKDDGNTLFVISDKALDCDECCSRTWEENPMRSWLNIDFYDMAFNIEEQKAIVEQTIVNVDSEGIGGNDTNDKVYFLSYDEVTNPEYGFCGERDPWWNQRSLASASRQIKASDYACANGLRTGSGVYAGNCSWWLRASSCYDDDMDTGNGNVIPSGRAYGRGEYEEDKSYGVVPVLHIDRLSDCWTAADDESNGAEQGKIGLNPVHQCVLEDVTDWNYVYFGSYPQAEVTGDALTRAVTGASYDTNGDAWVDGIKYRRISRDGTWHYFKWERIRWRVLKNDRNTLFVAADKGLAFRKYNEEYNAITWENCTLRNWLNSDFYCTAFSSREQGAIVRQEVVNEDTMIDSTIDEEGDEVEVEYNVEGGNDTSDNVFLLSLNEVQSPEYGFCRDVSKNSSSRFIKTSNYAWVSAGGDLTDGCYEGNVRWWLRSPGRSARDAAYVGSAGDVCYRYDAIGNYYGACIPVMHIDLSSDLWLTEDDGTSGAGGSLVSSGNTPGSGTQTPGSGTQNPGSELQDRFKYRTDDSGKGVVITDYDGEEAELAIPSVIDGKAVTGIGASAFEGCHELRNVTIPDSLTVIGSCAFEDCIGLESVAIPGSVKEIDGSAFTSCESLISVILSEGLERIGASAFAYCYKLENIVIPGSVTGIGEGTFRGCRSLSSIGVEVGNANYTSVDGILCSKDMTELICYPNGKGSDIVFPASVKKICAEAFADFSALTSINIPEGVEEIGWNAFSLCSNLESITIPGSVREIMGPDWTTRMFFAHCGNLKRIDVDGSNTEYMSQEGVLYSKNMTELICCPPGKSGSFSIPDGVESIGSGAFGGCASLTGITIPGSMTSINGGAFNSNWALAYINVAESNPTYVSWEGILFDKSMTYLVCCPSRKAGSMVIPDGVTTIGERAFSCCDKLTSIQMPDSIKYIGDQAFMLCSNLKDVYYGGSREQWCEIGTRYGKLDNALPGMWSSDNVKIHYQKESSGGEGGDSSVNMPSSGNTSSSGNTQNPSARTDIAKAQITLKKASYTYDGKTKKPSITVKFSSNTLAENKDYKLVYKDNKNVGTASVTISGIGDYTGSITKTFTILPKGTTVSGSIKAKSKGFTVKWKKKSASGYQVQYSTSKKFTKKTTVTKTVKKKSTTKLNVGKLKANKKYYVRVRVYQTVKGKKYESAWSKAKAVKTKK